MIINKTKQRGAVSLFIVVFSALLITIVTIGFVGIMVKDQQQATATDLSQSAYDSAQAGVEDVKRALLFYENVCGGSDLTNCTPAVKNAFISTASCNDAVKTLTDISISNNEVAVEANGVSNSLDQAYTCTKVNLQTDDYIGALPQDSSKMIPLVGVSDFDTIKLEWFSIKDLQGLTTSVDVPNFVVNPPLLSQSNWTSPGSLNRPSIMRTQLIQFDNASGFALADFDNSSANASNNTLFLYPTRINDPGKTFATDIRRETKGLDQVNCNISLAAAVYSCSATIKLPSVIIPGSDTAYLNLTAIYKKTNYRITLLKGVAPVKFNAIQPSIDSTGRANNLFRRVQSRVELVDPNFPYPGAAINLTGDLCKDFIITDNAADYKVGANPCTP